MHDCSQRVKHPKTVADVIRTWRPSPLSLAVEVDNTQRSRAHVATGHPAAINLVRPNGQSSDAAGQMPNGKPEESCLRGGEEEDADGRRVRMSHHHQPPSLNFSSVKTAFIADGRRNGRSRRAASLHVFSSNISLAFTNHALASILGLLL